MRMRRVIRGERLCNLSDRGGAYPRISTALHEPVATYLRLRSVRLPNWVHAAKHAPHSDIVIRRQYYSLERSTRDGAYAANGLRTIALRCLRRVEGTE